jgi:peptide/nickel transport system permease protein
MEKSDFPEKKAAVSLGVEEVTEKKGLTDQKKKENTLYTASQWQLMWWRFTKNRFALVFLVVVFALYIGALLAPFIAPYGADQKFSAFKFAAPSELHYRDQDGNLMLPPIIYLKTAAMNPETFAREYTTDYSQSARIVFFTEGVPYKLFWLIPTNIHLFGTDNPRIPVFLFGTDSLGRDMFGRVFYGSQISLSIGLIGIFISFLLGIVIGGLAAHYGGAVDSLIQRMIEIIISIPTLPLWMGLSAAIPANWPPLGVYFGITIILSLIGWTGLARVIRGKFLSMRELQFITAARLSGRTEMQIIFMHMLPSFISFIIVSLTLSIPGMIMGETGLSFLGLGIKAPIVSWGVLLQEARDLNSLALRPWLLIPSLFLIVTVLAFNFVGDGLREAADPYSSVN